MSRDFGITDPEDVWLIEQYKRELKRKPQAFWDNEMKEINKICSDIGKTDPNSESYIGAGSGD